MTPTDRYGEIIAKALTHEKFSWYSPPTTSWAIWQQNRFSGSKSSRPHYVFKDAGARGHVGSPKAANPPSRSLQAMQEDAPDEAGQRLQRATMLRKRTGQHQNVLSDVSADRFSMRSSYQGGPTARCGIGRRQSSINLIETFGRQRPPRRGRLPCARACSKHTKVPDDSRWYLAKPSPVSPTPKKSRGLTGRCAFLVEDCLNPMAGTYKKVTNWGVLRCDRWQAWSTGQNPRSSEEAAHKLLSLL